MAVSGESVSGILIQSQGTFDITAEGSWGGNPARLNVTNNGTLTLDTQGIASISGGYVTMGTTKLNSGTLALGGQANQTAA